MEVECVKPAESFVLIHADSRQLDNIMMCNCESTRRFHHEIVGLLQSSMRSARDTRRNYHIALDSIITMHKMHLLMERDYTAELQ